MDLHPDQAFILLRDLAWELPFADLRDMVNIWEEFMEPNAHVQWTKRPRNFTPTLPRSLVGLPIREEHRILYEVFKLRVKLGML